MATYEITAVRTEQPYGYSHPHITAVELSDRTDQRFSRQTIINDLLSPSGDRYYTYAKGTRATVIVAGCPHCGTGDYITTEPDWTTDNNLLSLPRF